MAINVFEVTNNYHFDIFLRLPDMIYGQNSPYYPLPRQQIADSILKIPIENHRLLVAVENNAVVGRLAVMKNHRHPELDTALFGYFESTENHNAASELFQAAVCWAKDKGYSYLTGPVSYNTNDSIGMLVEGFEYLPQNSMPYNPGYYPKLLVDCGFYKHLDLLAYLWTREDGIPEKLSRIAKRARNTQGLTLRNISLNHIHREAMFVSTVHNQTMYDNWGSETLTVSEAMSYLNNYRSFTDPDLLLAVEVNGEPAGICLTLPTSNRSCRVAVLAAVPKYRTKGIAALLMHETAVRLLYKGYQQAELSLILENNTMMNRLLNDSFKLRLIKRYRVYRKNLS